MTLQIRILLSCVICLDVKHDNQANDNSHGVNYIKLVKFNWENHNHPTISK
jgi:hypothetical protein